MNPKTTFDKCIFDAANLKELERSFGEKLTPADCMNIMQKNYGERLKHMKPETLSSKIQTLMGGSGNDQEIVGIIKDYVSTFPEYPVPLDDDPFISITKAARIIERVLAKEDIRVATVEIAPHEITFIVYEVLPEEPPEETIPYRLVTRKES